MSAEDTLAVCMLVILALAGVTLMTILFSLIKNAGKKDELEDLLSEEEETYEDPVKEPAGEDEGAAQPWEKDSDWWKQ